MSPDAAPTEAEHPWTAGDATGHPRQCSAKTHSTGERCKGYSISGGTVCVYHGGSAPQVREAARRRINAMAPDALQVIRDLMASDDVPAAVRLRAAQDVLDRAGTKAPDEHILVPAQVPNAALDAAILDAMAARGIAVPELPAAEDQGLDLAPELL